MATKSQNRDLGHDVTSNGRQLNAERIQFILAIRLHVTKQHMYPLTGRAGYCMAWLAEYAQVVQPLADLIYGHKMVANDLIKWTPEAKLSFD